MSETIGKIFLSENLAKKLGIPTAKHIKVRAGGLVVFTQLEIANRMEKKYLLSPSLSKALFLKKNRLKIRYCPEVNILHLGPTVGVLSTGLPNREEFEPTGMQAELIYLSKIGKTLPGMFYIFTPGAINWSNHTVKGYNYRQVTPNRGLWVSSTYPLPDVVYDRVPSRRSESRNLIQNTKKKLSELSYIKYFNPSFFNKWQIYETLSLSPDLKAHLPETRSLNLQNLEEMLVKYRILYLKPSNGSLGKGIIKVRKNNEGSLQYTIYRGKRINGNALSARDLMSKTRTVRSSKSYIVQEGLDLATYHGSAFDIRIIYQKNQRGEWQISKKLARVAPGKSSISNLSSGGRAIPSKRIFRYLYRNKDLIEKKNSELKNLCRKVAEAIETRNRGIYGELGLDVGMGKDGKPYLIEVNSKPRKTTETEYSMGVVRNSFKRPLEYSSYLAGFPVKK